MVGQRRVGEGVRGKGWIGYERVCSEREGEWSGGLALPWQNFKLQKIVRALVAGKSEYPLTPPPIVRAPVATKSQSNPPSSY